MLAVFCLILYSGIFVQGQNFDYHNDFDDLLQKSKDTASEYYFPKLLERFNRCDSTLTNRDMIALQIGFTANKNYKPYKHITTERNISALIGDEKYAEAIDSCNKFLETNPVDFTALIEKSFAYLKLDKSDAAFHKEKVMKIIRSIFWSGDGTIEHPYFVLSPIDGQLLIRYVLGGTIGTMGSGREAHGYFVDILEMENDGVTETKYFVIEHATAKMFEE